MAVAVETVALRKLNLVVGVPVAVAIPVFRADNIVITYGSQELATVQNTDYTVTLEDETNFDTFSFTPLQPLLDKIDALIASDDTEINAVIVRRELDYLTESSPAYSMFTRYLSAQHDKTVARFQQVQEELDRTPKFGFGVSPDLLPAPRAGYALVGNDGGTGYVNAPYAGVGAINAAVTAAAESASAAATSATNVEAWAQSPTAPDPEDPTSKSAKTWAGQAEAAALATNGDVPYAARTQMGSVTVPVSVEAVTIKRFGPDDTIAVAQYQRVDAAPSHDGKFTDAAGGIFALAEPRVELEMFGPDSSDDTDRFIKAVAFCNAGTGCSEIRLRGKAYTIDVGGIVLNNVSIRGSEIFTARYPFNDCGTVIRCVGLTNPPFLLGYMWAIIGVGFYYPNQTTGVIAYPPTFETWDVSVSASACGFGRMVGVTVMNAYDFFHATPLPGPFGGIHFEGCYVFAMNRTFHLERGSPEVIEIKGCTFSESVWSGEVNTTVRTACLVHAANNGRWLEFQPDAATWQTIDGMTTDSATIVRGVRHGLYIISGALGPSTFRGEWEITQLYRSTNFAASPPTFTLAPDWVYGGAFQGQTGLSDILIEIRGTSTQGWINIELPNVGHAVGSLIAVYGGVRNVSVKAGVVRDWGRSDVTGAYYALFVDSTTVDLSMEGGVFDIPNPVVGTTHNGIYIANANRAKIVGPNMRATYVPYNFQGGTIEFDRLSSQSTVFSQSMIVNAAATIIPGTSSLDKRSTTGWPMFKATAGSVAYTAAVADMAWATEVFDKASNFATPTFTAPVAGEYEFKVKVGHTAGSVTSGDIWNFKVVAAGSLSQVVDYYYYVPGAVANMVAFDAVLSLAKGDTVKVTLERFSGSGGFTLIGSGTVNSFVGRLLNT